MLLWIAVYVCGWEESETGVDLWALWPYTTQDSATKESWHPDASHSHIPILKNFYALNFEGDAATFAS